MIKQRTIDDIIARWDEITPKELRAALMDPDAPKFIPLDELRTCTPEERGYAGPRERNANDQTVNIYTGKDSIQGLIKSLLAADKKRIVIVYPTSEMYLEYNKNQPDIHLARINSLLDNNMGLVQALNEKGIKIEYLPLIKMEPVSLALDKVSEVKSARFWSLQKPPKDASYLLIDDLLESGATIQSMLSHLQGQGVSMGSVIGAYIDIVCRSDVKEIPILQTDEQKQFISTLRSERPDIAERADIILHLIGIDSLGELTCVEAHKMHINGNSNIENFDQAMKLLFKQINRYKPIPEPTASYAERCKGLLGKSQQIAL